MLKYDYDLKFHIKSDLKPYVQKERKIPFHLREKVDKAIDEMLEQDLIEPVFGEATPFVPCFVPVPKPSNPNELRITLDSRVINQAIERERHNMPTVEDLMVELNYAKIMSKLDL